MRILVSNDDGIYSPGIAALARAAAAFGDVRVVAPDVEQSSAGHAITASKPLTYRETAVPEGFHSYRVDGTPADCVALGVYHWGEVDMVLSGVNIGTNLGNAIWHSGTLAAAKQAQLLGIPGVALSTVSEPEVPPSRSSLRPSRRSSSCSCRNIDCHSSTSTCRRSRRACAGPGGPWSAITARSCPAGIHRAVSTSGSP